MKKALKKKWDKDKALKAKYEELHDKAMKEFEAAKAEYVSLNCVSCSV